MFLILCPQGQVLIVAKDKSIKRSYFSPKRKTKFIIHGFIDTPLSNWVKVSLLNQLANRINIEIERLAWCKIKPEKYVVRVFIRVII